MAKTNVFHVKIMQHSSITNAFVIMAFTIILYHKSANNVIINVQHVLIFPLNVLHALKMKFLSIINVSVQMDTMLTQQHINV